METASIFTEEEAAAFTIAMAKAEDTTATVVAGLQAVAVMEVYFTVMETAAFRIVAVAKASTIAEATAVNIVVKGKAAFIIAMGEQENIAIEKVTAYTIAVLSLASFKR